MPKKILVIGDTHCRLGVDTTYLTNIGKYIVQEQPEVIVHLGNHWAFPSISTYKRGKLENEGRRLSDDIAAGNEGMNQLLLPMLDYNCKRSLYKKKQYSPEMYYCLGNHEDRLRRYANDNPEIEKTIGLNCLYLRNWIVIPFLKILEIEGVFFSHYFTTGNIRRAACSPQSILSNKHDSCIAGHQQGRKLLLLIKLMEIL